MKDIELEFYVLKLISESPNISQRELASELGISLGKTNYLVRALIDLGSIKLKNFRRSDNKLSYLYLITPEGIRRKATVLRLFFEQKTLEYNNLKLELEKLDSDLT